MVKKKISSNTSAITININGLKSHCKTDDQIKIFKNLAMYLFTGDRGMSGVKQVLCDLKR